MALRGSIGRLFIELGIKSDSGGVKRATSDLDKVQQRQQQIAQGAGRVGSAMTRGITLPVIGLGVAAFKSASDFESAFAGVRKTVDATEPEFAQLRQGILNMTKELPATKEEIAGVAEAAGQLGIKKENILTFTRTMIDLGESTNMSANEAATSLARLANITQLPQDQIDRLGATVVDLGNNMATTEGEIVGMSLRIAGAGNQIGLTEDQILSFAGALSSVGVRAEAGGTAISKTFSTIASAVKGGGEELQGFAAVAGMSADQYKAAFEQDAALATVAFIEGLDRVKQEGGNVFQTLEKLDLGSIRVRDALLRASGAGDNFRNALKLGSNAWKENTALTEEASKRYKTTESRLKILRNRITGALVPLGEALAPVLIAIAGAVSSLVEGFNKLPGPVKAVLLGMLGLAAVAGPILKIVATVLQIKQALMLMKGAQAAASAGFIGMMGPILAVVAAIAAIIAIVVLVIKHWDKIKAAAIAVWGFIKKLLVAWWSAIKTAAMAIFNAIKAYFVFVFNVYKTVILTVWRAIKGAVVAVWNGLKTAAVAVFNAIKGVIVGVVRRIRDAFQWWIDKVRKVKEVVVAAFGFIKNKVVGAIKTLIEWAKKLLGPLSKVVDVAGKVVGFGGKVAGAVGGFVGKLNPFAEGGFLKPGEFGTVGEKGPEIAFGGRSGMTIIPNDLSRSLATSGGGGDSFNIVIHNPKPEPSSQSIPRAIRRAQLEKVR